MENLPSIQYNPVFQGGAVAPPYSGISTNLIGASSPSFGGGSQVSGGSGLLGGLGSIVSSIINNYAEDKRAQKQREWSEQMFEKQNQWNLDMWNRTNEYNSTAAQVQRMKEAGLNTMYYGLDGSSASAMQSAQPMNYDRASNPNGIVNPIEAYQSAALKSAQLENLEAQTSKVRSETSSTQLDNEFKQKTMNSRVEGAELANKLTKAQLSKIHDERLKISAEIGKLAAETQNEFEKKALIQAETNLKNMSAKEIVELLPYKQRLMDAQTSAQKASASLAFAQAAIQKGLFNSGYVDLMLDEMKSKINLTENQAKTEESRQMLNEANAKLAEFRHKVMSGDVFDFGDDANWLEQQFSGLFNGLFNVSSMITTAIGAPITKIIGM